MPKRKKGDTAPRRKPAPVEPEPDISLPLEPPEPPGSEPVDFESPGLPEDETDGEEGTAGEESEGGAPKFPESELPATRGRYACTCGWYSDGNQSPQQQLADLRGHLIRLGNRDGKGSHRSMGVYDPAQQSRVRRTFNIADATRVRFVPREFVLDSSHLIWQAMSIAVNEWGWPEDMTPGDFLDTFLHHAFLEKGYVLGGYQKITDITEMAQYDIGNADPGEEVVVAGESEE